MTEAAFRKLALAFPDAVEGAHGNHPDFRIGKKIFATMGYPERGWAMVRLTRADQEAFIMMHPDAFRPVKGKWGEQGCTNVILRHAKVTPVRAALESAYQALAGSPATRTRAKRSAN